MPPLCQCHPVHLTCFDGQMPANPLQVWQCCFKPRPLATCPMHTRSTCSETCDQSGQRQFSRDSDWLTVFLEHPFLMHHLSFSETRTSELSIRQTFNLATLVPDAIVNSKNIWQKEPESYHGVLLCADVSGFTNLCEVCTASGRAGTYHITAALNHVFGAMVELIYRCDGDVLKFSGDALLATWRVDGNEFLYDVTHRVLSCGLLIQKTLTGYRTESNYSVKVKIAISAGEIYFSIIGDVRSRHYIVVGQPVKDVKEAGYLCVSGDVLVSPSAWAYCSPRNYDYSIKAGYYIKVNRIFHKSHQRRSRIPKIFLHGHGADDKSSVKRTSTRINVTTPSYSAESLSLSQRSSLPMGSASDSTLDSLSSSSSSAESFMSKGSIDIPQSETESISDATMATHDVYVRQFPSGFSIHDATANITIRPSVDAAARRTNGASFRPFMIPPVAQQVDADQPLEYLTEMRHVTTMFVNVKPDGSQSEADLIDLVDNVYITVCRLVYSSLGVVNKVSLFDKDIMMLCVFGLRGFKHQQESQSALRCGAIVHRMVRRARGVLQVSIGITTGFVYCGVVGHPLRREYTVVGAPVNYAARLMMAYAGKVSCEENTRRLSCLPGHLFHALPHRPMKGIKQTEDVFEYHEDIKKGGLGLISTAGPLLGRHDIIAEARHQVDPRQRKYKVLILVGEPRIGKSRVLSFLSRKLIPYSTQLLIPLQPMHSAVPFAAAHFISRQILGLTIAERQARVQSLLPDVSEEDLSTLNRKLAVNFARSGDDKLDSESLPQKMRMSRRETAFKLIVRLMRELDPLTLFLLDDVQYADEYSCQIAHEIVRVWQTDSSTEKPGPLIIAAVTVAPLRPAPAINKIMSKLPSVQFINVGPLPSELLPALACQVLNVRAVEFDLVRVLEENSRGNPGWCESYLSALLSSNGLKTETMPVSEMRKRTFIVPDITLLAYCNCGRMSSLVSTSSNPGMANCRSRSDSSRHSEEDLDEHSGSFEDLDLSESSGETTPDVQESESKVNGQRRNSAGLPAAGQRQNSSSNKIGWQRRNSSSHKIEGQRRNSSSGRIEGHKRSSSSSRIERQSNRSEGFKYLRSFFQGWKSYWKDHSEPASSSAEPQTRESEAFLMEPRTCEHSPRETSKRCSICCLEDESKVHSACLLAPHRDYNQEVAAHLNGAIVASFDSLPPMEQLLLKCGSVLGEVFPRSVLMQLLKTLRPLSRKRVAIAMQRLFEMCVFECSRNPLSSSTELTCLCDFDERECNRMGVPRYALCRLPRFRAQMVRSAIWDLLPIDQRRALHIRAARCLYRRRPICASCRARARLSISSSRRSRATGTSLDDEDTQVLFAARQKIEETFDVKDEMDALPSTFPSSDVPVDLPQPEKEGSSADSQQLGESASNGHRKSSFSNPVRFRLGLMGPTRTTTGQTGPKASAICPTKPALRKVAPVGQDIVDSTQQPPQNSDNNDMGGQVSIKPPSDILQSIQDQREADAEQTDNYPRLNRGPTAHTRISPPEYPTFDVLPSILISDEPSFQRQIGETVISDDEEIPIQNRRINTVKRIFSTSLTSLSGAITRVKMLFEKEKTPHVPVSLERWLSCLPSAPCNNCECPMLLAESYQRLSGHCCAAGLKLLQLRFLIAYGALVMAIGYPLEASLTLLEAIKSTEDPLVDETEDGFVYKVQYKEQDIEDIVARMHVLVAEARLQIGDIMEARHFINKEKSYLPWRWTRGSAHAHAVNSDIYTIEGEWAQAKREALKSLKAAHLSKGTTNLTNEGIFENATWALAAALDAARQCGHTHDCVRLERALADLDQHDTSPSTTNPFPGNSSMRIHDKLENPVPGVVMENKLTTRRNSSRKTSVSDPRRARAAARLLYSIFMSRLYRGSINDALEPGEAALSASEAMGATYASAAILPYLALAQLLLLNIPEAVALIHRFRKLLEKDDYSVDSLRASTNPKLLTEIIDNSSVSIRFEGPSAYMENEENMMCLSIAEYHCVRLDSTLFMGVSLSNAQKEAEKFIRPALGLKTILTPGARRIAARLSLLNARKERWTECALLATMASPSLALLESDANAGIAEIGRSAVCLLEAALYGRAKVDNENKIPAMVKMIQKIPQWINTLREFVKSTPLLEPRLLVLSAYYEMQRCKYDKAKDIIEEAFSIAEEHGNRFEMSYISLQKAVWQGRATCLSAADWLSAVEQSDHSSSETLVETAMPLACSVSSERPVDGKRASSIQSLQTPPPSPTSLTNSDDGSTTDTVNPPRVPSNGNAVNTTKSPRKSIRLSVPKQPSGRFSDTSSAERGRRGKRDSPQPSSDATNAGNSSRADATQDIFNAIFFCFAFPEPKRRCKKF